MPEAFVDWGKDAKYQDLLALENDLGNISTLICIIPESPGSIAELGAFAVNPDVQHRLAILMPEQHYRSDSFINNALLRRLKESQIIAYDWCPDTLEPIDDFLGDIINDLDDISDGHKTERFQSHNFGHKAFCVFQIIYDLVAARLTEVRQAVDVLGLKLADDELKRIFYILEKLKFIVASRQGRREYFSVHPENRSIRVDYTSTPNKPPFDRDRLDFEVAFAIREERRDRGDRTRAIAATQGGHAQ